MQEIEKVIDFMIEIEKLKDISRKTIQKRQRSTLELYGEEARYSGECGDTEIKDKN